MQNAEKLQNEYKKMISAFYLLMNVLILGATYYVSVIRLLKPFGKCVVF